MLCFTRYTRVLLQDRVRAVSREAKIPDDEVLIPVRSPGAFTCCSPSVERQRSPCGCGLSDGGLWPSGGEWLSLSAQSVCTCGRALTVSASHFVDIEGWRSLVSHSLCPSHLSKVFTVNLYFRFVKEIFCYLFIIYGSSKSNSNWEYKIQCIIHPL